jgi:hypothetical protein
MTHLNDHPLRPGHCRCESCIAGWVEAAALFEQRGRSSRARYRRALADFAAYTGRIRRDARLRVFFDRDGEEWCAYVDPLGVEHTVPARDMRQRMFRARQRAETILVRVNRLDAEGGR